MILMANRRSLVFTVVALAFAGAAFCQDIAVTVDGREVAFVGTRPMTIDGRVLVPLRGVLEEMGAFVSWVAKTRTVVAQKGDTYVELPVGSRTATVNGRMVTLDVPAAVMAGSTMVPLRFLGEALGADVRWVGASRTVAIVTDQTGPQVPVEAPVAQDVAISSFSHNAKDWLRGGAQLQVTLTGSQGGQAKFEIPGVVDQIGMQETGPGRYTGSWTVPTNTDLTVSGASVIGLLRVGQRERLIQAGDSLSIDTVPPKIRNLTPEPDTSVPEAQPSISAVLTEQTGSGIDVKGVTIEVNGKNVTAQATVTQDFVSYRPSTPLPSGRATVKVSAKDKAGNTTSESWAFIARAAADVITSFTHSSLTDLQPGDVITVTMEGEPGGTASFSIVLNDEKLRTEQMRETSAGVYAGEYTIRRNDTLAGASIVGSLTTRAGHTYTTQSAAPVTVPAQTPAPPKITSPAQGVAVASPLQIEGTAAPNTRVRLRLDYQTTVLGALTMTGVLTEQTVDADGDGRFKSEPINLGTLVKGKGTTYTLTAVSVGATGEESEPAVVRFQPS